MVRNPPALSNDAAATLVLGAAQPWRIINTPLPKM
jgi:hypothetical protein